jgi:hypothetical protein
VTFASRSKLLRLEPWMFAQARLRSIAIPAFFEIMRELWVRSVSVVGQISLPKIGMAIPPMIREFALKSENLGTAAASHFGSQTTIPPDSLAGDARVLEMSGPTREERAIQN